MTASCVLCITNWLFTPTNTQSRSCLLRFHFFGAPKDAIRGKIFGSYEKVAEAVDASTKFKMVQDGNTCSPFFLVKVCWSWWRLCRKLTCVIHPSNYPMSIFRELYNKLLAIKTVLQNVLGNLCTRGLISVLKVSKYSAKSTYYESPH
jgi:hypothetical protein